MKITETRFYKIKNYTLTPITTVRFPNYKEISNKYGISKTTINRILESPNYDYYKDYNNQKTKEKIKMEIFCKDDSK